MNRASFVMTAALGSCLGSPVSMDAVGVPVPFPPPHHSAHRAAHHRPANELSSLSGEF